MIVLNLCETVFSIISIIWKLLINKNPATTRGKVAGRKFGSQHKEQTRQKVRGVPDTGMRQFWRKPVSGRRMTQKRGHLAGRERRKRHPAPPGFRNTGVRRRWGYPVGEVFRRGAEEQGTRQITKPAGLFLIGDIWHMLQILLTEKAWAPVGSMSRSRGNREPSI